MNDNPMHAREPHARHSDAQMLADRLNIGWVMCEREANPERKENLEQHWIRILHEYEQSMQTGAAA